MSAITYINQNTAAHVDVEDGSTEAARLAALPQWRTETQYAVESAERAETHPDWPYPELVDDRISARPGMAPGQPYVLQGVEPPADA